MHTRCSAAGVPVSGPSLVAEIAALPDDPADDETSAVECGGSNADNELANMYVHEHSLTSITHHCMNMCIHLCDMKLY